MKQVVQVLTFFVLAGLINTITICSTVSRQDDQHAHKLIICGGGDLPDSVFKEFHAMAGREGKLVVIPTASKDTIDVDEIKKLWQSRGFSDVNVLHTRDRDIASTEEFIEPLKTTTAVWFSGGSQQRIADAYVGTPVEKELYNLVQRGGVIGGSSAGAAIQSRVMIKGGKSQPKISTGLDLLAGAIIDQHFLKRNRLNRLIEAVRVHPELIGYGIDEGTAIVVSGNKHRVVGSSNVLRIELIEGEIKIDAFEDGDVIPLTNRSVVDEIKK